MAQAYLVTVVYPDAESRMHAAIASGVDVVSAWREAHPRFYIDAPRYHWWHSLIG